MKNKSYSKTVAVFALVLAVATSSWFAAPAMLCYAQGGYAVDYVGGGGIPYHPGLTSLSGKINLSGVLTEDVIAESDDELWRLTLSKGITALKKTGYRLSSIIIVEAETPPPPPHASVIGRIYDFSPDGATFDPPAILTTTYDPALIPATAAEEKLVIAMWDEETDEWVNLVSTVDPVTNTITAGVSHFTYFTVLAYTRPAAFTITDLVIAPVEVDTGKTVTVSALVTNTGDLTDSYKATFKIDNVAVDTREVTLTGGASQKVFFLTSRDTAGTYAVNVDGLSGTLVVKTPPAPPAPPPPAPAPPVAPPAAPPVAPPVAPPAPPVAVNWWLIGPV